MIRHIPMMTVPYYTMPFDYIDLVMKNPKNILITSIGVDMRRLTHGNYFSDLMARRAHQASNGLLQMLELEYNVRDYTKAELDKLCRKQQPYRKLYAQAGL